MDFIYLENFNSGYFSKFLKDLQGADIIGLDTETSNLDVFLSKFLLLQFNINNTVYVIDPVSFEPDKLKYIIELVKFGNKLCIGHNIKFDIKIIKRNTGILLTKVFDTMVVENVLMAGIGNGYPSLADLVKKYVGVVLEKDIRKEFIDALAVTQDMLIYSALDVKYLIDIYNAQKSLAEKLNLGKIVNLENLLVPVVADMEYTGVKLNTELWNELNKVAKENIAKLGAEILDEIASLISESINDGIPALEIINNLGIKVRTVGERRALGMLVGKNSTREAIKTYFNLDSNIQVKKALQYMGIPVMNNSKEELGKFKHTHPIIEKILDYKYYSKRLSSFGDDFIQKINPVTGRLHATFNQMGTATGRWSSDNPNLQQIPRKNEENNNSRYRDCFIASEGFKLLTVDYNQAELRLLGAVSEEEEFIKAYNNNIDIHALTASHIFHKPLDEVSKNERWIAKQVNFAIVYGSSEYGLNYNFGIPLDEGKQYLEEFFRAYPRIKQFMEFAGRKIWELKYSITPLGRKRFFEDIKLFDSMNDFIKYKKSVIRKGNNHIIQGGSADILKLSFVDIYYNNPFGDGLRILMSVHDEGVFEVGEDIVEDATEFVVSKMKENEQRFLGPIPAAVDYKVADTWSK